MEGILEGVTLILFQDWYNLSENFINQVMYAR